MVALIRARKLYGGSQLSTLHIVTRSPFASDGFDSCLSCVCHGHVILLIQNAVIVAIPAVFKQKEKSRIPKMRGVTLYALEQDLKARGLSPAKLLDWVKIVDYAGFVDLLVAQTKTQTWG